MRVRTNSLQSANSSAMISNSLAVTSKYVMTEGLSVTKVKTGSFGQQGPQVTYVLESIEAAFNL